MDSWIVSSRADGVLGSGTESDPWSGGLRATTVVGILPANVTLSALVGTFYTITISGTSHPFLVNDFVLMNGFSLPNGELLNGTFKLTAATATSFSFQVYFEPPNTDLGLTGDLPYLSFIPGTDAPTAQLDPYLFDAVMRSLVAKGVPVTIHLGPGGDRSKNLHDGTDYIPRYDSKWDWKFGCIYWS